MSVPILNKFMSKGTTSS